MPGRYAIISPPKVIRDFFRYEEEPDFPPRYNIAPTQPVPVVRLGDASGNGSLRHFVLMRWGFIPAFVRDPRGSAPIINARAETAPEKPSFRAAVMRRRCLFIADAFYQWQEGRKPRRAFMVRRPDGLPFGMAGIWECWASPDGSEIDTACILTTSANGTLSAVSERMPIILEPDAHDAWLDCLHVGAADAMRLARAAPDETLALVEIGEAVNRVANDGPFVQEPRGANSE